jgi:putative inorganic carbon (HCO3(-)) transporter
MALVIQLITLPMLAQYAWSQRQKRKGEPVSPTMGSHWRYIGGSALLAACLVIAALWIGAEPVMSRLSLADQFDQSRPILQQARPAIWKNSMKLILAHPVFGVGFGAYSTAFPHYDDSTGYFFVNAAHNDYVQGLAETGMIGGILGLAFLYCLARLVKRTLSATNPWERSTGLAGAIGCIGLLAHSLVDFNLQITSNALLFLILVAILDTADWRMTESDTA